MQRQRSKRFFSEAQKYLPGGVNSPVRAFKAVEGEPIFIAKAQGSKMWDVDGNEYIDYVLSWGPMILGHGHPRVVEALKAAVENGTSFGAPSELEVKLARMISEAMPSMEMIRMVNSGTEATMSAIRLARAYTNREKVLKFEGCYHGHADSLLIRAGSGATTLGIPDSPGIPQDFIKHTLTAPYNDLEGVKKIFAKEAGHLACVIVEPVAANMGVIPPKDGFLEGLRQLTQEHDVVLIFDEVISGFRVSYGGAQKLYRIKPDLTCLGKIIGGGLPIGVYGGRREIMQMVAPSGPVYQAGTLSGNPVTMTAGIATLEILSQGGIYEGLEEKAKRLFEGLVDAAQKAMIPINPTRIGSLLCLFFTPEKVINYTTAKKSDTAAFGRFFSAMLEQGIYLPPSQFEAIFLSTAHSHQDIEQTL
ncbi:MAG: glutamate-1-semialdehyde 2,1-aminomutase, partial [Nitrospiria bacterium]